MANSDCVRCGAEESAPPESAPPEDYGAQVCDDCFDAIDAEGEDPFEVVRLLKAKQARVADKRGADE